MKQINTAMVNEDGSDDGDNVDEGVESGNVYHGGRKRLIKQLVWSNN